MPSPRNINPRMEDERFDIRSIPLPPAWTEDAACAQVDPELFFPEVGGSGRDAKAICATCPVSLQCAAYALDNGERFGIWSGANMSRVKRPRRGAA